IGIALAVPAADARALGGQHVGADRLADEDRRPLARLDIIAHRAALGRARFENLAESLRLAQMRPACLRPLGDRGNSLVLAQPRTNVALADAASPMHPAR